MYPQRKWAETSGPMDTETTTLGTPLLAQPFSVELLIRFGSNQPINAGGLRRIVSAVLALSRFFRPIPALTCNTVQDLCSQDVIGLLPRLMAIKTSYSA